MTNIFERDANSPMLKGEAHSEKEAELFDKRQEVIELPRQIDGAVEEVILLQKELDNAQRKFNRAKENLDSLRKKNDRLSEEIPKLEKEVEGLEKGEVPEKPNLQENHHGGLDDHPPGFVRKAGENPN